MATEDDDEPVDYDEYEEGNEDWIKELKEEHTLCDVNGNELKIDNGGVRVWLMAEPKTRGVRWRIECERLVGGRWESCDNAFGR